MAFGRLLGPPVAPDRPIPQKESIMKSTDELTRRLVVFDPKCDNGQMNIEFYDKNSTVLADIHAIIEAEINEIAKMLAAY